MVIELTQGQELRLASDQDTPLTRIRVGLGWDKERTAGAIGTGAPDVDLDASAVQFSGEQLFDLAFYNNLATRDGSVEHLGDNLSGRGEGDDEVISIDLGKVYAKVDTIVFMVSSYQGHTLEWVDNAYCRLVDDEGTELARFTLTGGVPETGLAMAKLVRDRAAGAAGAAGADGAGADGADGGWRLVAIGEGIAATIPTESVGALRRFL